MFKITWPDTSVLYIWCIKHSLYKKSILHGDVFTCNTTYEEHFGDATYSHVAGHIHCTVSTWTRSIEQKQSKVNKAMKVKLVQYFKKITVSKVTSPKSKFSAYTWTRAVLKGNAAQCGCIYIYLYIYAVMQSSQKN